MCTHDLLGVARTPVVVRGACPGASGFTLIEMLVVVGLIGVLVGVSVMMMPGAIASAKADSGAARLVSVLRIAREAGHRPAPQRAGDVHRPESDRHLARRGARARARRSSAAPCSRAVWSSGCSPGLPDTPDAFGNATATAFGSATTLAFTSEGEFVDQNGDPVNGTVFVGRDSQPLSARAVTIFGPTALIREWRWNGSRWTTLNLDAPHAPWRRAGFTLIEAVIAMVDSHGRPARPRAGVLRGHAAHVHVVGEPHRPREGARGR